MKANGMRAERLGLPVMLAATAIAAAAGGFLAGSWWERQQPIPAEELYLDPARQTFRRVTDVDTTPQFPIDRPKPTVPSPPAD
jgi:hypothetical protein